MMNTNGTSLANNKSANSSLSCWRFCFQQPATPIFTGMKNLNKSLLTILAVCTATLGIAQKAKSTSTVALKESAISDIQSNYNIYKQAALQIWNYAELGYKENNSSALLQQLFKTKGICIGSG